MSVKLGTAAVKPRRQKTQYNCTVTSLAIAMSALGFPEEECRIDRINEVLGAMPLHGASWDQVAGAASHFGCRAVLMVPSTLNWVRKWTDKGIPVLVGWTNGVPWAHASVIYDVTDTQVLVADPNISNPEKLTRVFTHDEWYEKWYEMSPQGYKVRRPAMAIMPEISPEGRQMIASATPIHPHPMSLHDAEIGTVQKMWSLGRGMLGDDYGIIIDGKTYVTSHREPGLVGSKVDFLVTHSKDPIWDLPRADDIVIIRGEHRVAKAPTPVQEKKKKDNKITVDPLGIRNDAAYALALRNNAGGGTHKQRELDVEKGRSRKEKHPKKWQDKDASERLVDRYLEAHNDE